MGVRHMGGSPWHIEYANKNKYGKRYKTRCRYYRDHEYCKKHKEKCCGTNICEHYTYCSKSDKQKILDAERKEFLGIDYESKENSKKVKNKLNNYLKIGSTFTVKDCSNGECIRFKIVEKDNIDIDTNKIDNVSSLAIKVANAKIGDKIEVNKWAKYILISKH